MANDKADKDAIPQLEKALRQEFEGCGNAIDAAKNEMKDALEMAKEKYGGREAVLAYQIDRSRAIMELMRKERVPSWIVELADINATNLIAFAGSELNLDIEKTIDATKFFGDIAQILAADIKEAAKKGKQG